MSFLSNLGNAISKAISSLGGGGTHAGNSHNNSALGNAISNAISQLGNAYHPAGNNFGGSVDNKGNFISPNGATGAERARQAALYYSSPATADANKLAAVKAFAAKMGYGNVTAMSDVMNRGTNTDTYLGSIYSPTRSNQDPNGKVINPTGLGNFVYVGVNGQITPVGPVQGKQMQQNAIAQGYDPTVGGRLIEVTKDNLVSLPNGGLGVHANGVIYGYGSDASSAYAGYSSGYKPMSTSIMKEGTTLTGQKVTNSGLSPWGAAKEGDAFNQSLQGSWQIDPYGGYQRINDAEAMKNAYYNVNVNDKGLVPKSWDEMLQEVQKMNSDPYAIASNQQNMMKGNTIIGSVASSNQADGTTVPATNTSTYGSNPGNTTTINQKIDVAQANKDLFYKNKQRNMTNDGSQTVGVGSKVNPDVKMNAITARVTENNPKKLLGEQKYIGGLNKTKKQKWGVA